MVVRSHLSLTGASGKIGLYLRESDGTWFLPSGTAPSTHIVKQSHVRLKGIVTNEQLTLMTAAGCGIEIPESFIVNTGFGRDDEILLATRRYDRVFGSEPLTIDGIARPLRLHQEDFGQAMGIPAREKYEYGDNKYLAGMFRHLRHYSSDPVSDIRKLWDRIVFNFLIGNTDAHIKNYSLLYSPDMRMIRLAPAYDMLSTTIYESSSRDMAFSIGEARSIDEVTQEAFLKAASEAGIGRKMAMERLNILAVQFIPSLKSASQKLSQNGFPEAERIAERIIETGGIRNFS